MNLIEKDMKLLEEFLKEEQCLPIKNLMFVFGVSEKTIRNSIGSINVFLEKFNSKIVAKRGEGYYLRTSNREEILKSIRMVSDTPFFSPSDLLENVFKKLIEEVKYIKLEELCDEYYVSRSKMSSIISKLKKEIQTYGLVLMSKPHYGFKISGTELGKRLAIANMLKPKIYLDGTPNLFFIEDLVVKEWKIRNINCSDIVLQNIIYHIKIMIRRVLAGHPIDIPTENMTKGSLEYIVSQSIIEKIENAFMMKMSAAEIVYVYSHLSGQIYLNDSQAGMHISDAKINMIIDSFLEKIESIYDISLWKDQKLRSGLLIHLSPLIGRIMKEIHLRNPILHDIKKQFAFAFNLAVLLAEKVNSIFKCQLTDDDIAYLTMHIGLALERDFKKFDDKNFNRIAIICTTGQGTAQLLKFKIEQTFPKAHTIKNFSLYHKEDVIAFNPDIIFSTVPIEINNIPIEVISPFFTEEEQRKLIEEKSKVKTEYILDKYFSKDIFQSNLDCNDQKEAITKMCDLIGKTGITPPNFEELCLIRESLASTAFGNQIALVHPIELCSEVTKIGIGILKKPIDWSGVPVKIIFTIAQAKSSEVRDLLLFIQELVHNKELMIQLSEVNSFDEWKETIINYSENL
ncbi:BglG family transcription antiterminator [Niallia circulans]|uniref:BglG family transcription antiterminator n=1 Tax=Niallia circulans TaxID=1397 RepID=UPI00155F650C|nr:BglG family transcription antiterminator [Niallia circulans]NRG34956.1 transcription antiterminator [Niallia circulans]